MVGTRSRSRSLSEAATSALQGPASGITKTTTNKEDDVKSSDASKRISVSDPAVEQVADDQSNITTTAREDSEEVTEGLAAVSSNPKTNADSTPALSAVVGVAKESRKKQNSKSPQNNRNELTHVLPGYTAPMELAATSLDTYRTASGGLEGLRKERASSLPPPAYTKNNDHRCFKTGKRRKPTAVDDAGAGWFGMRATPLTEQVKQDLKLIRNRNYLDPKRFYKSADVGTTIHQVGTVIEGAAEYYSSRLTKKQRKSTLVEEVMADPTVATYAQNKYRQMQQEKTAAAKKRKRRGKPRGRR